MTSTAQFEINYHQHLGPDGVLSTGTGDLQSLGIDKSLLLEFYQWMQLTRVFDSKAIALQRTGRLGTYASCLGQEGLGVAIGKAMREEDVFIPSYRETATLFTRGVKLEEALLYWGGDERGMDFDVPKEDMPCSVPIATQCCHAVGISYAFKLRRQPRVAVVVCGDGGTSKGDFYESINAAGVWQLPLVFVVSNNQWAISVPRSLQSHTETLAQKAIAGGISCEQIDGNDIIGCYLHIRNAIERAREGAGPHLIEALTYRLSDHTTADDASRYRDKELLESAWKKEPLTRLRKFLLKEYLANREQLETIDLQCGEKVEKSVQIYLNTEAASPESMLKYLYKDLPHSLRDQFNQLKNSGGLHESSTTEPPIDKAGDS